MSIGEVGHYCQSEYELLKHDVFIQGGHYYVVCQSCGCLKHISPSSLGAVKLTK